MQRIVLTALMASVLPVVVGTGQSNIDPTQRNAWGENIGWTNWRDANSSIDGVAVAGSYLSGFVWAENVGWINVGNGPPADGIHYANTDDSDFGVNTDTNGGLFGLAWGENIGWVNFDTSSLVDDRSRFDACEHVFSGYAWGENIGWINLGHVNHYVAVGPCVFGDYDCDGDVDLDDFASFSSFLSGPDVAVDCPALDSDAGGDIDLKDFAMFQQEFTGASP
ncbi:MAG: hypothetical protein GY842_29195 [bacterium]|nr:hypothetical protein [bacterium]